VLYLSKNRRARKIWGLPQTIESLGHTRLDEIESFRKDLIICLFRLFISHRSIASHIKILIGV
jgi:hypothetical protein